MRIHRSLALLFPVLLASVMQAQNITGTVTNGTTNKPATGVDVALIDPMGGMAEIASAKADAQGHFTITAPSPAQGPRLVRATKEGVNYFKMITPGSTSADLQVFDAAKSVDGIKGTASVVRLQAQSGTLQGQELYAIRNESKPPRTLVSENTFEVVLPDGAQLDAGDAQSPGGQPISVTPTPTKQKNHYAFSFALKPGETRFQLAWHMPYSGQATIKPQLLHDYDHYVVVVPSTIKMEPKTAGIFSPMQDQASTNVQVSGKVAAGQDISFNISGTGVIPDEQEQAGQAGGGEMGGAAAQDPNRPGGGLGRPIDSPDALAKYRWPLFGLLLIILLGGGIWVREQTKKERPEPAVASDAPTAPVPAQPGDALLSALREELFQLEIERQQGKISDEEYTKAKAALDQTLARALSRNKQTQGVG